MSYKYFYKNFQRFIDEDKDLTEKEQELALEKFQNPFYRKIFRAALILLIWSSVGLFIDSFIIGGSSIAVIMKGFDIKYLLPTLIFSITNWIIKVVFIYYFLEKKIPKTEVILVGVPYVGSALVLSYILRHDPYFKHTLFHYLKWLKKKGFSFIISMFRKK